MRKAILLLVTLLVCPYLPGQENAFRLNVISYQWITTHKTFSFSSPGHGNTSCNGTANMSGNISGGGNFSATGTSSDTCSTSYTPPSNQEIDIQRPVLFILAETATNRMILTCTRKTRWSQCHALNPGEFFARLDKGVLEVSALSAKGKEEWIRFDVVQQSAISSSQGQTVPVRQPAAPPSPCPTGKHRVSTSYGSYCEADAPSPLQTTLAISSTPLGAEIELDGNFIGNTPSTVSVSGADHSIKLTKAGYVPWERTLKTSSGTVTVAPELVSLAPTQIGK